MIRAHGEPPMRYCFQHQEHAPTKGGQYIVHHDGMTRRWMCANCLESAERRKRARMQA